MDTWALLAPGPSATTLVDQALRHDRLGVIGNAFELVGSADFLVSADRGWWLKHPAAFKFNARLFCNFDGVIGTEYTAMDCGSGSGVIGLEIAKRMGAKSISLYGFDMHGSHFFGEYTNGLRNTNEQRRMVMLEQFAHWAKANRSIAVTNRTPGSAITCFPFGE